MKVAGSYESVLRGVSQQVPQDRRSGQHSEQVNLISDPVRGLARRHGSILMDEQAVTAAGTYANVLRDTAGHRTITVQIDGVEYDLITRHSPAAAGEESFMLAFNRSTKKFIPVLRPAVDAELDTLISGGVSAATGVGRYAYLAGHTLVPKYQATDTHGAAKNLRYHVAWVRGGAYSRTFKVKITKTNNSKVEASYKTLSASYPELLDTSGIAASDTEYQKKINDMVYAYNSAVTEWIGKAAADITPENIAAKLAAALTAKGIAGVTVKAGTVLIDDPTVKEIDTEDGGDGSLLRGVGNEVSNAELVSTIHRAGKVVKIKPQRSRGDDAFYLIAVAKDDVSTGWTEITWRECAGYSVQPTVVFAMATIAGGSLCIAGTPAKLQAITGIEVPGYSANAVGDGLTSPIPTFFGSKITYLGMFQDRLVIVAGSTVFTTRPGDYLNFWRQSVLTVLDTDPWEGYALGAEHDEITSAVTFDRDLVLFGRKHQYAISGRSVLTPKTASIVIASSYKDGNIAPPKSAGNYVFYTKYETDEANRSDTTLHQVSFGPVAEASTTTEVSQQLDGYMQGKPVEIVAVLSPNLALVRTEHRGEVYCYGFFDGPNGERVLDNWSRWTWAAPVGSLVSISEYQGSIIMYMLRQRGGALYIAAELFSTDTSLSTTPYADSLQMLADAEANPAMSGVAGAIVALARDGGPSQSLGNPYEDKEAFKAQYPTELARAWVGFPSDAYVTPTNPYIRDKNDRAILNGRFVLSQVRVSVADTGGMLAFVSTPEQTTEVLDFNGRIVGAASNTLVEQPIVTTSVNIVIGKEIREGGYALYSKSWLPLTITALEWTGLVFSNKRRM